MDKYEFKLRLSEIDKLIEKEQYADAVRIADTIDWRHVKKVSTITKIAELYKMNKRFEECKDLLEIGYDRNPYNKRVVYDLCEVYLEYGDVVNAVEYFKEFAQLAPNDIEVYFLKYRLYKIYNVGIDEKIEVLEALRSKTRIGIEEWEYELAELYHKNGMTAKCVEVCDEIILWNNNGPFVTKAMELKMLHEPLTPAQQYKYEHRNDEKYRVAAEAQSGMKKQGQDTDELGFKVKTIDMANKFNTMNLQAELAQNISEYLDDTNPAMYAANTDADMQEINVNTTGNVAAGIPQDMLYNSGTINVDGATKVINVPRKVMEPAREDMAVTYGATTVMPNLDRQAAAAQYASQQYEAPQPEIKEQAPVQTGEEVFFADKTADIRFAVKEPEAASAEVTPEMQEFRQQYSKDMSESNVTVSTDTADMCEITVDPGTGEIKATAVNEALEPELKVSAVIEPSKPVVAPVAAPVVNKMPAPVPAPEPAIDRMLTQNSDGQISMAIEEPVRVEKQITGQMSINDILNNWEKQKANRTTAINNSIDQRILESTGKILDNSELNSILDTIGKEEPKTNVIIPESAETPAEEDSFGYEPIVAEPVVAEPVVEESVVTEPVVAEPTIEELMAKASEEETAETVTEEAMEETVEESAEVSEKAVENTEIEEVAEADDKPKYYGQVTDVLPGAIWKEVDEAPMEDAQVVEVTAESEPVKESVSEIETAIAMEESAKAEASEDTENEEPVIIEEPSRDITKEEKKMFNAFLYSKAMKAQIVNALDKISLAAYTGNVIITSEGMEAGSKLAKSIIKYVQASDDNFSGAIAKITADKLNQKSVSAVIERVGNGALIVEGASDITEGTINELCTILENDTIGAVVILIDRKGRIDRMLKSAPMLKEKFNARIDIVTMNTDALVDYGVRYAMKEGFSIDDMALLAFYKRVQDLQAGNHMVTLAEVREVIDAAIKKGSKKGLGSLARSISGKKYDEDERIILREKDFDK